MRAIRLDDPELTASRAKRIEAVRAGTVKWGPWRYEPELQLLVITTPYRYEIDLESCVTSAEVLDWIMQIAGKTWGTAAVVGHLVLALNEILRPQETLCSWGKEQGPTAFTGEIE